MIWHYLSTAEVPFLGRAGEEISSVFKQGELGQWVEVRSFTLWFSESWVFLPEPSWII